MKRGLLAALVLTACGSGSVALTDAGPSVPDSGLAGQGYVASRGCAACHQSLLVGAGTLSGQTDPVSGTTAYGRNLTPDPATGVTWTDAQLANALRYGIDDQGFNLCPTMPRFERMSDAEVQAINAYLRSLPPVHRVVPPSICP